MCTIVKRVFSGVRVGFIREKMLGCVVAISMMGNCSANDWHCTGLKIAPLYISAIVPSLCKGQNTSTHTLMHKDSTSKQNKKPNSVL